MRRHCSRLDVLMRWTAQCRDLNFGILLTVCLLTGARTAVSQQYPVMNLTGDYNPVGTYTIHCYGASGPIESAFDGKHDSAEASDFLFMLGSAESVNQENMQYQVPVAIYSKEDHSKLLGGINLACTTTGTFSERFDRLVLTISQSGKADSALTFRYFPYHCWDDGCNPLSFDAKPTSRNDMAPVANWRGPNYVTVDQAIQTDGNFQPLTVNYSSDLQNIPISGNFVWTLRPEGCWSEARYFSGSRDQPGNAHYVPISHTDQPTYITVPLLFDRYASNQNSIEVKVRPWCAFFQSIKSEITNSPSANVWAVASYSPSGGRARTQNILNNVTFTASPGYVFLVGLLGIVIGACIRSQHTWRNLFKLRKIPDEMKAAVSAGIGAELVCLIGASFKHEANFFGIALDPRRPFACFLIALVASGGTVVLAWLASAGKIPGQIASLGNGVPSTQRPLAGPAAGESKPDDKVGGES